MYNQDLRSTITNIRLRIYQKAESQLWSYRPQTFSLLAFYNMYQVLHTRFMVLIYADPDLYIMYHCITMGKYIFKNKISWLFILKKNTLHTEILTLNVEMCFFSLVLLEEKHHKTTFIR